MPRQEVLDSQWFLAMIYSTRAIGDAADRLLKSAKILMYTFLMVNNVGFDYGKKNAWQIMRNGASEKECRLCILPVRIDFYNWHVYLMQKLRLD